MKMMRLAFVVKRNIELYFGLNSKNEQKNMSKKIKRFHVALSGFDPEPSGL